MGDGSKIEADSGLTATVAAPCEDGVAAAVVALPDGAEAEAPASGGWRRDALDRLRALGAGGADILGRKVEQFSEFIGYTHFRRPPVQEPHGPPPQRRAPPAAAAPVAAAPAAPARPPADAALDIINAAIASTPAKGQVVLPGDVPALAELLAAPPPRGDLEVLDQLCACFGKDTRLSSNRLLLAVARNLATNFGRPGRLPMASRQAWQMLDPVLYVDECAGQLAAICNFILGWQKDSSEFLILEFAETQLVQYFFENLHPRHHGGLLLKVMQFKALSTQRLGFVRRIPARVEQIVKAMEPGPALEYIKDTLLLLEHLARPDGFPPIVSEATAAQAKVTALAAKFSPQVELRMAQPAEAPAAPPPVAAPPPPPAPAPQVVVAPPPPQPVAAVPPPPPPIEAPQLPPAPTAAPPQTLPVPTVPPRRLGQDQKTEAVLRVLRGESLEAVAASVGTRPQMLAQWQARFLEAGSAGLVRRRKDATVEQLRAKVTDLLAVIGNLSSDAGRKMPLALPSPSPQPQPQYIDVTPKEVRRSRRKR